MTYAIVRLGCGHPQTVFIGPSMKKGLIRKYTCVVCGAASMASTVETIREQDSYGGESKYEHPRDDASPADRCCE